MAVLEINNAEKFEPLLAPARYKAAYGGRGSGKSHFFAQQIVADSIRFPGLRTVCVREVLKSLKESAKKLIEDKIKDLNVGHLFEVQTARIITPGDGVIVFEGMQDHNAESIKSFEGFGRCWVEEAQTLSDRSLTLLRPTVRREDSEIWFSWNPRRKTDAVDNFFRGGAVEDPDWKPPPNAIIAEANWRDNPWFPQVLEAERRYDLKTYPERYDHIWEGGYAKAFEGAYYARLLNEARAQGRIGFVAADPILPVRAFWDIGGSGDQADATAIWIVQWINAEIRVLDYIEGRGQVLGHYVNELRRRKWEPVCYLPHDGMNANNVTGKRFQDHLEEAGFDVASIRNQGKGAAVQRIEAARRIFPMCRFNEVTTEAGRDALGFYHEKKDENRNVGLGPEHDWSSHCFTGDTEVLTRYGKCQIKYLPNQGDVLTSCGWKAYRNPRITRRNAPLVEVRFADGLSVKCTPDHLFATASGWTSAQFLKPGLPIRSGLTPLRRISMAACTVAGRAMLIGRAAAKSCIAMFGHWRSILYPLDAISTIGITTPTIISCPIWSVYRPANTCPRHGSAADQNINRGSISAIMPDKLPQSGTHPMPGDCGTGETQYAPSRGRSGIAYRATVWNAARRLMRLFAKVAAIKSIVRPIVKSPRIESVRSLSERQDVWCLTVPDGESFALVNGAIVHNCADAFGLMAICYDGPDAEETVSSLFSERNHRDDTRNAITGY